MMRTAERVEVRSKEEILATLDKNGRLEGLPFMPEMFRYCGQRFEIYKSAYKSCDTVSGRYIGLRIDRCVHLELRCDGGAHGGCQAGCLMFWKEAWLKPVDQALQKPAPSVAAWLIACAERDVIAAASNQHGNETVYSCQATSLLNFTRPLKWWDARQYAKAYGSGNRSAAEILRGLSYLLYSYGTLSNHSKLGAPWRWLYDRARPLWHGVAFPRRRGRIPLGRPTPKVDLDLKPGDLVRVKSYEEILATLDENRSNRGLTFDAELVPYCGKIYRVQTRVHRFIDEQTGRMKKLKTPAVILDGVVCKSRFSGQRMFCPREIYLWWREIWLERVEEALRDMPPQAEFRERVTPMGWHDRSSTRIGRCQS
ncbi:MAG: hypothetical protein M3N35_07315 [Candidatus Binatota bacterium]|nr:hypothetical protein [Candidatus Binatota bacterium]